MAVTPVIRGTQAEVRWQSARFKVGNQPFKKNAIQRWQSAELNSGNQPNSKVAISRIKRWQSAGFKGAIKIQLGRSRRE